MSCIDRLMFVTLKIEPFFCRNHVSTTALILSLKVHHTTFHFITGRTNNERSCCKLTLQQRDGGGVLQHRSGNNPTLRIACLLAVVL